MISVRTKQVETSEGKLETKEIKVWQLDELGFSRAPAKETEQESMIQIDQLELFPEHKDFSAYERCPWCNKAIKISARAIENREELLLHLALNHKVRTDNPVIQAKLDTRVKRGDTWSFALYKHRFTQRVNAMAEAIRKQEMAKKPNGVPCYDDAI